MMKKKLLALVMGTSLVLAACGGNDDSGKSTTADANDPANLYKNTCSSCHGVDLTGGGGPDLTKVGATLSQAEIETIIKEGKGYMPKGLLDEKEAAQVAEWLASKK